MKGRARGGRERKRPRLERKRPAWRRRKEPPPARPLPHFPPPPAGSSCSGHGHGRSSQRACRAGVPGAPRAVEVSWQVGSAAARAEGPAGPQKSGRGPSRDPLPWEGNGRARGFGDEDEAHPRPSPLRPTLRIPAADHRRPGTQLAESAQVLVATLSARCAWVSGVMGPRIPRRQPWVAGRDSAGKSRREVPRGMENSIPNSQGCLGTHF